MVIAAATVQQGARVPSAASEEIKQEPSELSHPILAIDGDGNVTGWRWHSYGDGTVMVMAQLW